MRKKYDAVIVGGGPGGLAAGCLLARVGISSAIVEKAFPGFNDAIEHEGMNLQLNFTRYAYAVVPVELDLRSPNIEGLYFAGDSVRSVGTQMSDKCFDHALPV